MFNNCAVYNADMSFPDLNTLHCMNFFEFALKIPDGFFHLIINDPPYNIAKEGKITFTKRDDQGENRIVTNQALWGTQYNDNMSEDEYNIFMTNLAQAFFRILSEGGSVIIFYDFRNQTALQPFYDLFGMPKNVFVFLKDNPTCHVRRNNYRSGYEQAAWFSKGTPKWFYFGKQQEMINTFHGKIGFLCKRETTHPNEKYGWEIEPFILHHSRKKQNVLDCMGGSGTVSKYCKIHGRNFVYCDMNPKWIKEATKRLKKVSVIKKNKTADLMSF